MTTSRAKFQFSSMQQHGMVSTTMPSALSGAPLSSNPKLASNNYEFPFWKKMREPIILLMLAWHFSGIVLWCSPECPLRDRLITPFVSYLNFFGLWQGWQVFEKPRLYNGYLTALVTFSDGTQRTWNFPRMEKLGLIEKMFKEKYRRWTNDCVSDESKPYLWPDAARYIARLYRDPVNQPVSVSIIRHWVWIPPPEKGLAKELPEQDDGQNVLYTGQISAEDLK